MYTIMLIHTRIYVRIYKYEAKLRLEGHTHSAKTDKTHFTLVDR